MNIIPEGSVNTSPASTSDNLNEGSSINSKKEREENVNKNLAQKILTQYLSVQDGEEVLIIADGGTSERILTGFRKAAQEIKEKVNILIYNIDSRLDMEMGLPQKLKNIIPGFPIIISATADSVASCYSGTIRRLLDENKIRNISMVKRSNRSLLDQEGANMADYDGLKEEGDALKEKIQTAHHMTIESPNGTSLDIDLTDVLPIVECGRATKPGETCAGTQDGEVSFFPPQINGRVTIDGPLGPSGIIKSPDHPLQLEIKNGEVVDIINGETGQELKNLIENTENFQYIAEVGIGINPYARLDQGVQEAKKAKGTIHIALGDNGFYVPFGDKRHHKSRYHMDMVIKDAKIKLYKKNENQTQEEIPLSL